VILTSSLGHKLKETIPLFKILPITIFSITLGQVHLQKICHLGSYRKSFIFNEIKHEIDRSGYDILD